VVRGRLVLTSALLPPQFFRSYVIFLGASCMSGTRGGLSAGVLSSGKTMHPHRFGERETRSRAPLVVSAEKMPARGVVSGTDGRVRSSVPALRTDLSGQRVERTRKPAWPDQRGESDRRAARLGGELETYVPSAPRRSRTWSWVCSRRGRSASATWGSPSSSACSKRSR
jgi:hypothetical protein